MKLIVESERWCEAVISHVVQAAQSARCGDVATTLCTACGVALCDDHESICDRCGRSFCSTCDHTCASVFTNAA